MEGNEELPWPEWVDRWAIRIVGVVLGIALVWFAAHLLVALLWFV